MDSRDTREDDDLNLLCTSKEKQLILSGSMKVVCKLWVDYMAPCINAIKINFLQLFGFV